MIVSSSRSQWRSYVAIVLGVLIMFLGWVSVETWGYLRIAPGEDAQHLKEFLKSMPPSEGIYSWQSGASTYLEVVGTLPPWPFVVSGPPIYIFDTTGKLVDWTAQSGEDSAFERRWPLGVTRRRLMPHEALELLATTDRAKKS